MTPGLREWAMRRPDQPALLLDGTQDGKPDATVTLTFADLEAQANQLAHLIRAHDLAPGAHIAALLGNDPAIVALCWAAQRAGVYLTPIPTRLSPQETNYIVKNATAALVFATPDFAAQLADVRVPILDPQEARTGPREPISDERPGGLMMYSSGTTGAPKGIIRPLPGPDQADKMPGFARDLIGLFGLTSDTRYLSTQPLYHAAALRFVLAIGAAGGTAVVMPRFDAGRALELLDSHNITLSQWVPTMFRRLLDLPKDRRARYSGATHHRALHGAAPCTPALKRAMLDWWGPILTEYYSGSEGIGLTMIDSADWRAHPGSVGRAVKGVAHILGPDDTPLEPEQTGRVFFSETPPFAYFGAAQKTAEKTSRQGWQTFGDIGRLDEEGYLYLSDRADDMIISGGVNLYPQEIEAAIEDAPFVAACGVIGVPDPTFEERPVAFVVPTKDAQEEVIPPLKAFLETRLGRVKHPRDIVIVDRLPMSDTGKLLRRKLRDFLPSLDEPAP
ncbi:MAG: AMP-binding protein [Maritimibacter sp.]